jgi:hypothetical protein
LVAVVGVTVPFKAQGIPAAAALVTPIMPVTDTMGSTLTGSGQAVKKRHPSRAASNG